MRQRSLQHDENCVLSMASETSAALAETDFTGLRELQKISVKTTDCEK